MSRNPGHSTKMLLGSHFVERWLAPDGPILLNEKCLRKGGIFRLNGGPCWMNRNSLRAVTTLRASALRASLQNAP